jgi:hypothetical protein
MLCGQDTFQRAALSLIWVNGRKAAVKFIACPPLESSICAFDLSQRTRARICATLSLAMKSLSLASVAIVCLVATLFCPRASALAFKSADPRFNQPPAPRNLAQANSAQLSLTWQWAVPGLGFAREVVSALASAPRMGESAPIAAGFTPRVVNNTTAFLVLLLLLAFPCMLMIVLLAVFLRIGWRHAHPAGAKGTIY